LVLLRAVQLLQCVAGNIPYLYARTVRDIYLTKYLLSIGFKFVTQPGQVASRADAFQYLAFVAQVNQLAILRQGQKIIASISCGCFGCVGTGYKFI
jgi:hypothetical protein